jgi:small subunit ribosomal protein S5
MADKAITHTPRETQKIEAITHTPRETQKIEAITQDPVNSNRNSASTPRETENMEDKEKETLEEENKDRDKEVEQGKVEAIKEKNKSVEGNDKEMNVEKEDLAKKEELKEIEEKADKVLEKEVIEKEMVKGAERKFGRGGRFPRKDRRDEVDVEAWAPKTKLGKEVKAKKVKDIDDILGHGKIILESEIVDSLMSVKSDLISIGQSKGKFGGGKRRAWKQTQRKTKEGNVPTFSAMAVIGDENGHVGIGTGRAMETLPARAKAVRQAKLNVIQVNRGCGSFDCADKDPHSIPFKVEGKSGSVRVVLIPAPQGTGLVIGDQGKKILKMAGIKDIYSKTFGKTKTTFNFSKAIIDALLKTNIKLGGY